MPDSLIDLAGLKVNADDFLAAVLETTAQPVAVVDPEGRIRFANPAAIAALGYASADELLERHDWPMLRPPAAGEVDSSDLDWFVRHDGSMLPVSYVSVPIDMPEGCGAVVAFSHAENRVRGERLRHEHEAILAAQRRIAAVVAGGAASADVLAAVAEEVGHMTGLPMVAVWRYEPDGTATVIGAWGERPHPFQVGTHWPIDGPTIAALVLETGRPARIDDFADLPGTIARTARETGIRSVAGAPVVVDGDVWGAMVTASDDRERLPDHIEDRLAEFTALVATAISNTAKREELVRLADEQAALRRVATLVARGVPPPEVFAAVAREVGLLLGVDWAHMARYEPDGTSIRVAGWSLAGDEIPVGTPERDLRSSVGAPIVVDQRVWGVMLAASKDDRPLPADAEARIAAFTELVATAISNTEARTQVGRLAEEQAALRRVATLVAQGVPSSELFGAVTEEVGRLFNADLAGMIRYETDATVSVVVTWAAVGEHPDVPTSWPTEEGDPAALVANLRRAVRIDDWDAVPGPLAAFIRDEVGISSSVGGPIVVEGRLWGALAVHSKHAGRLPLETESRLENFTQLVATAMSNAQARAEVERLAEEQAALRRVATLVAREPSPAEVFAAVTEEVGRLLHVADAKMLRYEPDGTATVVASWGELDTAIPVGSNRSLEGDSVSAMVRRTERPARIDDYADATGSLAKFMRSLGVRSSVATPIVVGGRLWGAMVALSRRTEPLPATTEARTGEFTELVATAIANIETRSELAASRGRIVEAADAERRRVVRDLHDGAQQRLVHTIITLKLARQALEPQQGPAFELLSEALDHARRTTTELRELAHGMLPEILTQGGLRAAIPPLASQTPVPVELDVSPERLPAPVEATAYFVVAEALTNVAKHARAEHAAVMSRVEDGSLLVQVRDDGVGGARPGGSGFVGLADRLAALDGRLRVESPAGGGTLVAADIPLSR